MKRISILLLTTLLLLISSFSFGQLKYKTCNCSKNIYNYAKADTAFHLSNGKTIVLCGDKGTKYDNGKIYFSEFVLSVCGEDSIINKFWGAVQTCHVRVINDTLLVETMVNLPTGKNMASKWTVWTIEHIYFVNDEAILDFKVNRQIPKYNQQQIELALTEYEHAKVGNTDANMKIADKLLISTISGSQKARTYLISLKERLGILSGEMSEWYNDDRRMLKLWDTNIPNTDDF